MFKFALICACYLLLLSRVECIPEEMKELAQTLHNMCQSETKVTEANIEEARKGNFVEDPALKCYMKCLYSELAVMDDDGMMDLEAALAIMPEEIKGKLGPILTKCGTIVGSDPCDNAFLTNKCWYEGSPQDYMLI